MAFLRQVLRLAGIGLFIVLAFAGGALAVLTLTQTGRDNLAGIVSTLASSSDRTVRIGGLSGVWANPTRIETVVVEDRDGPWLALRGVEIDWSRLALLGASFTADRVAAARIEIARAPTPAADAPTSTEPFSLPLSVSVKAIDLPDIALGAGLAGGRVASVAAKGSIVAVASPLAIRTRISAARSDGTAGDLDATMAFVPSTNVLDIDMRASEPSGGIIASLLDLPDAPSVDILVSGAGSATDWRGSGTFAIDGKVVSNLSGRYRLTEAGHVVEAKGDGAFARFAPQKFQALLDGKSTFDIAGTFTTAGGAKIERATLESAALEASAKGSIDPEGASDFALDLAARGGGVPLSFGTKDSPIDISVAKATVRVFGAGSAPALDIAATLPSVATTTTTLKGLELSLHSDGFDLATRSGPWAGNATAASLVIDNPTLSPLVAGVVRAKLDGMFADNVITVGAGSLTSDAVDGAFGGAVSLADGAITLDLKADILSAALPVAAQPLLGARVALSTSLASDAQGHVSANALSLRSGGLALDGVVGIAPEGIDASVKGTFADVSAVAAQATGAVAFSVSAKGPLAGPDVSATVTSAKMTVAGRDITGLELTASGAADLADPAAEIALRGTVGGEALTGNAVLKTTDGRREIKGLSLVLGQNRISGDLTLDADLRPVGAISFQLPDIGPLAALALETAEGDLGGSITFEIVDGAPKVTLAARSGDLARGDVRAKGLAIEAVVENYLAGPAVSGAVRAQEARSGSTLLSALDVTLSRDGDWTRFAGGAELNGDPVKAAGRLRVEGGVTTVELASGEAGMRGIQAALARPSTVTVAGGQATLEGLALAVGGGTVTVSGAAGATLNLTATLAKIPAGLANGFAPGVGATGTISGTVKATGPAANPTVGYTIDWTGAQTSQTVSAGFGAMSIRSSGSFASGTLTFDASVGDGSGLTMKGGGTVATAGTPQLALDFAGSVPLSFLTQRLAAQGLSLSGASTVSLRVRGAASAPVVDGSIRAAGLRFVDSRSGIAVDDIAAEIALGSGRATITRLAGTLSTGGTLSASGTVGIDAAQGFPADLSIRIADGRYTDGQVVTTTLSGALSVKGALVTAPLLTGTITLGRTVITVPEKLPGSLAALDVQHKNAPATVNAQDKAMSPASTGGGGGGLTLDVTVDAPQQIFVQGRGLDAELGGSLRLTGPAAAPQATGQFTMKRGRLSVMGKRLTFTRGTLGFSGSLVPYLDLSADSTANDATVTVLVTGPANNPKFTFSSIPSLPEDEVLARLVFGRSMSNLSPVQIAQLAEAAAQFAGVGGSTSLLDTLRGKIGIDDLDIKTDDQGGTAVSAGKYLNDRTYVTIEKGDKAGSGKAAIDLNVGRGVKLRGEATDDGKAKGGIFFEREY